MFALKWHKMNLHRGANLLKSLLKSCVKKLRERLHRIKASFHYERKVGGLTKAVLNFAYISDKKQNKKFQPDGNILLSLKADWDNCLTAAYV